MVAFHTPQKWSTSPWDSLGRLTKMQLVVLDIRIFSFLKGKTLVTEITITQGQEERSDTDCEAL